MAKEQFEWIHSWCDEADKDDLPRVLLVGDSITHNYQEKVREAFRGVCYVDYISTSYSVDSKIYKQLVSAFVSDSRYQLIHFHNGTHGLHMGARSYKANMKKMIDKIKDGRKLILVTTTYVKEEGNKKMHAAWGKAIKARNKVVFDLAKTYGYPVDDLYPVSKAIPNSQRHVDGTHYENAGYQTLADAVVRSIKENL